ncbi:MAG TPA: AAA family ATPase [Kofleriaceae bacterium]|nr:AAA family ATPase [Kofleriaceae bacterium]
MGERGERGEALPPSPVRAELIDFAIERQRHRRFVGREDVLAQLDAWLVGPGEAGWVVVTGGPGMGKSAALSAWLARRETAGAVVPHHFIRRQVVDWDQPERIAGSLAAQIEAMFPELRDPAARPEGRLIELLGRVSKRLGSSGELVVLVDGLDETRAEPGDNPLPRFLPHEVPAGIRLLCAMRPTYPHLGWIEARSPARRIDLDDRRWAASNAAVVRGFWEAAAAEYKPPLSEETRSSAIERAEGNVLHAVMLHDALRGLPAPERRADRIPRGLKALIGDIWSRVASDASVRAGLELLCAAQEALSLDVLGALAGWSYGERERFVPSARELLLEEPASWAGIEAYRPRHDWVRELMAERLGTAAIRAQHETLGRKLATWPARADTAARRYALRHALLHRIEAGDWADAWRVAADMAFLEAKCRELGAHEAEADVTRAAERCRVSGDAALCGRFDDLARALVRESHWLRAAPEAPAALVWNRLRQSGWDAEQIEQQLQIPAGATFLRVRHLATRESPALVRDLAGHTDSVLACAVTADGRRVVSASADKTLKVWDLASGRELATLQGHSWAMTACAVTPDGRRVISALQDHTLKVWDLASGRELATLRGHADWVAACAVTPDGQYVVSASNDKTLKVWDLAAGRELATLRGHTAWVTACAVTADGRCVVSASADKTLKVWDPERRCELATLRGHAREVTACAVTPDGRRAVSASHDQVLKVWDLERGRELASLQGHASSVTACVVTPDGRRVISASQDHTLKVWDLDTGRVLAAPRGHIAWVNACVVTPDGRRVVSASHDQTLKVWDLASGRELVSLQGHASSVTACAVTPDGRRVVSASEDQTLKVWNLEGELASLRGHADWVTACAVTPDGWRVVSASYDQTLKVWDLDSRRELSTLRGHADWVTACAVTPDGRRVVSASNDKTLKVWDLDSGRELAALQGHADRVTACAVTPDGRRMVSASNDKTLKVWDLETGVCLLTHRANAAFFAVAATETSIIAGDSTGAVWFLDGPSPDQRESSSHDDRGPDNKRTASLNTGLPSQRSQMKHTILFLAASPGEGGQSVLEREARAIQKELESAGHRDCFEFETRWAVEPLDLLRELRKLKPTVVHFTGRGDLRAAGAPQLGPTSRQDVGGEIGSPADRQQQGLFFQDPDGHDQFVSAEAIGKTFGAAGSSVRLVVLNACYSESQAKALLAHVDCVLGMSGSIHKDAARTFAIGFYGGLGERESVAAAYEQGCAAISLQGLPGGDRPQLEVRAGVDATKLVLASDPS